MKDSFGTYDGRVPEPPYECPSCAALRAEVERLTNKLNTDSQNFEIIALRETERVLRTEVERLMNDIVTLDNRLALLEKVAEAADKLMDHPYGSVEYELEVMRLLPALDAAKEGKGC